MKSSKNCDSVKQKGKISDNVRENIKLFIKSIARLWFSTKLKFSTEKDYTF